MGDPQNGLIDQAAGGLLLLGPAGERIVEHYSFYAVFQTAEEYRLLWGGRELGTLPVVNILIPGMLLIFSGRRWRIVEVDDRDRVISLATSRGGAPPIFGGDPGDIHDKVVSRMIQILEDDTAPIYLDAAAAELLDEGRRAYRQIGPNKARVISQGPTSWVVSTRKGTVITTTLALALQAEGFEVEMHDGFLEVSGEDDNLFGCLTKLRDSSTGFTLPPKANLSFEKFHPYLTRDLLLRDALSCRLTPMTIPSLCSDLLITTD